MKRERRKLRKLCVCVLEMIMKRCLGSIRNAYNFEYHVRNSQESMRTTAGLPELERFRGLTSIQRMPYIERKLSHHTKELFTKCPILMILRK